MQLAVGADDSQRFCSSCRLTRTRPNDGDAGGLVEFAKAEAAKRRLLFTLLDLGLPIDRGDLHFDLLSSRAQPIVTGHDDGLITLDLAESDDVRREARRAQLDEPYRTLLGHFRHEIGHYYWPMLVESVSESELERFRALFGDERVSYEESLEHHYAQGPPDGWRDRYVSAYATMHPGRTGPRASATTCTSATRSRPPPSSGSRSADRRSLATRCSARRPYRSWVAHRFVS